MTFPRTLDLFCRVVDNFGDIGICWRLARQLTAEHGMAVTLWVDDLASFKRIWPEVDAGLDRQQIAGVRVVRWLSDVGPVGAGDIPDVVIEGFGCALPDAYIAAMAARPAQPAWINLEYLSAEAWVEGCHAMQSLHPALPLKKHFFFPGFTGKTGGLLLERDLFARRDAFQQDPEAAPAFLATIGAKPVPHARTLSLFCYPHAPVGMLFDALQSDGGKVSCLVPEGVASEEVGAFLGRSAEAGAMAERGGLTVQVVPFLIQPDYDRLLWSCDLNFVRGEDSIVRAQWAARPAVWQIYPQEEGAHLVKLEAFLDRYTAGMTAGQAIAVRQAWDAWNAVHEAPLAWPALRHELPTLEAHARVWAAHLRQNGDLASNLIEFLRKIC